MIHLITFRIRAICLLLLSLAGMPSAQAQMLTIVGPDTICIGNPTPYTVAGGSGAHSWFIGANVTPTGGPIPTTGPTITITGVSSGPSTLAVVSMFGFGSRSIYVTDATPVITSNFQVGCQTLAVDSPRRKDPPNDPQHILDDENGCVKVCDSSIVRYYANGNSGSTFNWTVIGGTIITDWGDSVDVFWGTAGTLGSITVTETSPYGCTGTKTICIIVTERPEALFAILPDTAPTVGPIDICKGDEVFFADLSVADVTSPIVSWLWDFGDGVSSAQQHPSHTYSVAGNYTVSLVVKNQCNCTDTFEVDIIVHDDPGPDIICPSIVCERDTARYSTNAVCGTYNWSVIDGTILSGAGTNSILVQWGDGGTDGFGYVSLSTPGCNGICPGTTTVKIPIIQQNATITGPDVICTGQEYQYSLPLWAATQYKWGVISDPTAIQGQDEDHKVVVNFNTPGTYTIHGWYQNRIKLCGGDVKKVIKVVDPSYISGDSILCKDGGATYTLSGGAIGDWVLQSPTGVITTGTGNTYTASFPEAGTYLLSASGSVCVTAPYVIHVQDPPAAIDTVMGEDTVCLNRPYTYIAGNDIPGTTYNWVASGGTVSPMTGNEVTVVWTDPGPKQLIVNRVNMLSPFCGGPKTTIDIIQEVIDLNVTGDTEPCPNAYRTYTADYDRGETYEWIINPSTAGSVMSGNHESVMQILWNNNTVSVLPVDVIVKVTKCDTIVYDTLEVMLQPAQVVEITGPATACPGEAVVFTATSDAFLYNWNFGDGSPIVTVMSSGVAPPHSFPENITTGNMTYHVSVTVSGSTGMGCPPYGTGFFDIEIKPGPVAYASSPGPLTYCIGATVNTPLIGTYTNNTGGMPTFLWTGGTSSTPTSVNTNATSVGGFQFTVTAGNGCSATSNTIQIEYINCGGSGEPCDDNTVSATATVSCNEITLIGSGAGFDPTWHPGTAPANGPIPGTTTPPVVKYNNPGVYTFGFSMDFGLCLASTTITATIGIVPKFYWGMTCGPGNTYTVSLHDHSPYLDGWNINPTGFVWESDIDGTLTGNTENITANLTAGQTHVITMTITGLDGNGDPFSCQVQRTVVIPDKPIAEFLTEYSPTCEDVPISFTAVDVVGSLIEYSWDFGDGSGNLVTNPEKTYVHSGTGTGPEPFSVTLTVTDSLGCIDDTAVTVEVYENLLNGSVAGGTTVCQSDAPITLTYDPDLLSTIPSFYQWSNDGIVGVSNTLAVSQSGAYWVTVYDVHSCQFTTPSANVTVIKTPPAVIFGDNEYCKEDVVKLSAYAGPGVSYEWFRNGSSIPGATGPELYDAGLGIGTYTYYVVISIVDPITSTVCTDTSATLTVNIYANPAPPTITGPAVIDCPGYHLQLTASGPGPGYYNWSNGTYGAVNDIYAGGPYRVWYTDEHGCKSHADKYVPQAPSYYFPYFPVGCYDICKKQLPITLYGPPGVLFASWDWLKNTVPDLSGFGYVSPYDVTSSGTYAQTLDNGLCKQTVGDMVVNEVDCGDCDKALERADLRCDSTNPGSYILSVIFNNPSAGTSYTIGTSMGPVVPFSGILTTTGPQLVTLSFTTLTEPPPAEIWVEVIFTIQTPTGPKKCYAKIKVKVPYPCGWPAQRLAQGEDPGTRPVTEMTVSTAMMVHPNPASQQVFISYDYGRETDKLRYILVYDAVGRKVANYVPNGKHGQWEINTAEWAPGVYIIRMEAEGMMLQTQRLVITR